MAIDIVWPEQMSVPSSVIETWFVEALAKGRIYPTDIGARTPETMAQALHHVGIIHLRANSPSDITNE